MIFFNIRIKHFGSGRVVGSLVPDVIGARSLLHQRAEFKVGGKKLVKFDGRDAADLFKFFDSDFILSRNSPNIWIRD